MIMMYKRVLPQLLALLLLLLAMATAFGSIRAVAEDEPTPEPTAIPAGGGFAVPDCPHGTWRLVQQSASCHEGVRDGQKQSWLAQNRIPHE